MVFYNKKDDYAILPAMGVQNRLLLMYIAAAAIDEVSEYSAGDTQSRQKTIRQAQATGALKGLQEVPEGKDLIQVTYNPYHRFVVFNERLSQVDYNNPGPAKKMGRFKSKTFKQTLTLVGKEAAKSKGKSSRKDWSRKEGETTIPSVHTQVALSQGAYPTHLLKAESLQADLDWYLGLKGIDPVVLMELPEYPANPMGKLDATDIKKINTIYAEDFEKYGYTKL